MKGSATAIATFLEFAWIVLNRKLLASSTTKHWSVLVATGLTLNAVVAAFCFSGTFMDVDYFNIAQRAPSLAGTAGFAALLFEFYFVQVFVRSRLMLALLASLVFVLMALLLLYKWVSRVLPRLVYAFERYRLFHKLFGLAGFALLADAASSSTWISWGLHVLKP